MIWEEEIVWTAGCPPELVLKYDGWWDKAQEIDDLPEPWEVFQLMAFGEEAGDWKPLSSKDLNEIGFFEKEKIIKQLEDISLFCQKIIDKNWPNPTQEHGKYDTGFSDGQCVSSSLILKKINEMLKVLSQNES